MKRVIATVFCLFVLTAASPGPISISAFPTIAGMKALGVASSFYPVVQVLGYNAAGDGGGGIFVWNAASVVTADNCINFAATGVTTGRWVRQNNGSDLTSLQCGAYNDNTHASATQAALQAGVAYLQSTQAPQAGFHIVGGTYACGTGNTCIQTNASQWCPRIYGDGPGSTDVQLFTPSGEGNIFLFNSGNGNCNGGGVENLRATGNSHTNACMILSTSNAHCYVQANNAATVMVFCNCSSGGFSENDQVQILAGSSVINRYVEYRTSSGGSPSFRRSGIAPNSYIEFSSGISFNEIILIGASAQVYSCPINLSINYQPGAAGSTIYLINNQSSNVVSCSGTLQIEVDSITNPAILKLVKAGSVFYSGSIQNQITGTGELVYGNITFAEQSGSIGGSNSFKSSYVVLENAPSAIQYLTAGTGASTTLNLNVAGGTTLCDLQVFNPGVLNWSGQVLGTSSTIGSGAASIIAGTAFSGSAPTFTATTSGVPIITEADPVVANSTRIFGVCSIPGQSN